MDNQVAEIEDIDDHIEDFEDCIDELEDIVIEASAHVMRNEKQFKRWKEKWIQVYSERNVDVLHEEATQKFTSDPKTFTARKSTSQAMKKNSSFKQNVK